MSSLELPEQAIDTLSDSQHRSERTDPNGRRMSTLSVHAGEARQKPGDSITDPIFCASTYTFATRRR